MLSTAQRGNLAIVLGILLTLASGSFISSIGQDNGNGSELAMNETRKAYERGREMWFDDNLGTNGKSCESCHPGGYISRAESYPRYKHILRTMATVSITHNFAIVAESKGKSWKLGSEDANALALFTTALANGKKLEMVEPHAINKEWIKKGEDLFVSTDLGKNGTSCANCHTKKHTTISEPIDLKGIVAYYPKFRPNFGRVVTLDQQIGSCIKNKMDGKNLALDDNKIIELYCYLADISQGTKISVAEFE